MGQNKVKNRAALLAVICLNEFCFGGPYAWSVFSGPLAEHMGWQYSSVTFAYSLMLMVVAITGVVGGVILDRFGPRVLLVSSGLAWGVGWFLTGSATSVPMLYLSFGVLCGTASGLFYNPGIVTGVRWFPDRKGFASGLVGGVVGAAALVIAPAANYLLARYDVMTAFKIVGGVFFVIAAATTWFITNPPKGWQPAGYTPPQVTAASPEGLDKTWRQMLRDKRFYLIWLALLGSSVAGLMMTGHAASIGKTLAGITPAQAALLVGVLAAANFTGRFTCGSLTDKFGEYRILEIVLVVSALNTLLLANARSFFTFLVAIVVVGLCFGGGIAIFPTIASNAFGLKNMGLNYGITFTAYGIAAIVGPMVAARFLELSGSYTPAFVFAGGASVFSLAMVQLIKVLNKRVERARITAK